MRRLIGALAVVAALFSGAWVVLARMAEDRAREALAGLASQGWDVSYEGLEAEGFPSELALALRDLRVEGRDAPFVWEAPSLRLWVEALRPNRLAVALPPEQAVSVAGEAVEIGSEALGASATVGLSADAPLDAAEVRGDALVARAAAGWEVHAGRVDASVLRGDGASYDVTATVAGLGVEGLALGPMDLGLRGRVTLDRAISLRGAVPPRPTALRLDEARVTQGDVSLRATGDLRPDEAGFLSGGVTLVVEDWRALLDLLESSGLLPFDRRALAEGALEALSQGADRVEVPLTFEGGRVRALGIDLLAAPRLL